MSHFLSISSYDRKEIYIYIYISIKRSLINKWILIILIIITIITNWDCLIFKKNGGILHLIHVWSHACDENMSAAAADHRLSKEHMMWSGNLSKAFLMSVLEGSLPHINEKTPSLPPFTDSTRDLLFCRPPPWGYHPKRYRKFTWSKRVPLKYL